VSGGPPGEALRALGAAGAADISSSVLLRATGADRVSFLHRLLSCDVKGLAPGGAARGLLLTAKGKVVADFLLAVLPDRVEMVAPPEARPALRDGLARFAVSDDVAFADRSGEAGLLSLVGPLAGEAAAALLGPGGLPAADPGSGEGEAAGARVAILRGRRAGLPAVDLLADAAALPALRAAVLAAAAGVGGGPLGAEALEALRVESGTPRLGAEAGPDTLPQEAGLEDHVCFTKGCFLGQEPVGRLRARGHTNRGVAGLLCDALPAPGDAVLAGEAEAGRVTSAVLSPSLGRPIALALLRHEHAAPGTALRLRTSGGEVSCSVAGLPFVRRSR
jgi:folate-binding protein YgfZ